MLTTFLLPHPLHRLPTTTSLAVTQLIKKKNLIFWASQVLLPGWRPTIPQRGLQDMLHGQNKQWARSHLSSAHQPCWDKKNGRRESKGNRIKEFELIIKISLYLNVVCMYVVMHVCMYVCMYVYTGCVRSTDEFRKKPEIWRLLITGESYKKVIFTKIVLKCM